MPTPTVCHSADLEFDNERLRSKNIQNIQLLHGYIELHQHVSRLHYVYCLFDNNVV